MGLPIQALHLDLNRISSGAVSCTLFEWRSVSPVQQLQLFARLGCTAGFPQLQLVMTVTSKSRVPAEDLWYGTHRASMKTNVLLQHLDPGQVSAYKSKLPSGVVL